MAGATSPSRESGRRETRPLSSQVNSVTGGTSTLPRIDTVSISIGILQSYSPLLVTRDSNLPSTTPVCRVPSRSFTHHSSASSSSPATSSNTTRASSLIQEGEACACALCLDGILRGLQELVSLCQRVCKAVHCTADVGYECHQRQPIPNRTSNLGQLLQFWARAVEGTVYEESSASRGGAAAATKGAVNGAVSCAACMC